MEGDTMRLQGLLQPLIENEKHKAEIIQRLGTDKLKYETIDNLKEDKYITDVVTGL